MTLNKPKIFRDIDTINASLGDIVTNVKTFGAKGDGVTDDTQAILNAIAKANSNATNGVVPLTGVSVPFGCVYFPPGIYAFSQTLDFTGVSVKGAGVQASILKVTDALGVGVPAVIINPTKTRTTCKTDAFSEIQLVGVGGGSLGTKANVGDGIKVGDANTIYGQFLLHDFWVSGFDTGIVMLNTAHNELRNFNLFSNYYGIYFSNDQADNSLNEGAISAHFACMIVDGDHALGRFNAFKIHFNTAPFGIYQETGTSATFLRECTLIECGFEYLGNGAIYTENQGNSIGTVNHFYLIGGAGFSWEANNRIGSKPSSYSIVIGQFAGTMRIQSGAGRFSGSSGGAGISIYNYGGGYIEGDIDYTDFVFNNAGTINMGIVPKLSDQQSSTSGTSGGTAKLTMKTDNLHAYASGQMWRKIVIYLNSYLNSSGNGQVIDFPISFQYQPIINNIVNIPGLSVGTTSLTLNPNNTTPYTGYIVLEGF